MCVCVASRRWQPKLSEAARGLKPGRRPRSGGSPSTTPSPPPPLMAPPEPTPLTLHNTASCCCYLSHLELAQRRDGALQLLDARRHVGARELRDRRLNLFGVGLQQAPHRVEVARHGGGGAAGDGDVERTLCLLFVLLLFGGATLGCCYFGSAEASCLHCAAVDALRLLRRDATRCAAALHRRALRSWRSLLRSTTAQPPFAMQRH